MADLDLNEENVRARLWEMGGPPAVLLVPPGPLALMARRICQDGTRPKDPSRIEDEWEDVPAAIAGVEVHEDVRASGWRLYRADE